MCLVLSEGVFALEQKTISETLAMHMKSPQMTREFKRALGSAKIRIALQKKVRTSNTVYNR